MLSDLERKVFLIFRNTLWKHTPTTEEICRITGKTREEITRVLVSLNEKGYIGRNSKGKVVILKSLYQNN